MKVVINSDWGGFGLSDEAVEECVRLGMTMTTYDEKGEYVDETADFCDGGIDRKYPSIVPRYSETYGYKKIKEFRSNPILVKVVKKLKGKANGLFAKLKVVDIPFDSIEGWEIEETDGWETIQEIHKSWG